MMKLISLLLLCTFTLNASAQKDLNEEDDVRHVIQSFFKGFHAQDSIVMRSAFHRDPVIQTIQISEESNATLKNENLREVLKSIVSIPSETQFKEVIHEMEVKIDADMAQVWAPYSFYVNNELSHCGVNSFQLIKQEELWKIIYLVDTRRKKGCQSN